MRLKELIKDIKKKKVFNLNNFEVEGIAYDSRKIKENYIFVALKGSKQDGHNFINEAIERGAKCIIVNKRPSIIPTDITEIVVEDTKRALSEIANTYYNFPSKKLNVVGITGTNGKTTTSFIIKKILDEQGFNVGLIGTIWYEIGERKIVSTNTTPESLDLIEMFSEMVKTNCKWAVMEVSSHGIDQKRIEGIDFDVGIFTNIAPHEHLDYHKTFRNYLNAKLLFFTKYLKESSKKEKYAIINLDSPYSKIFIKGCEKVGIKWISTGRNKNANIKLISYNIEKEGNFLEVEIEKERLNFKSKISGLGNIYNLLNGIAFSYIYKVPYETIQKAFLKIENVPGRFEFINEGQDFSVIVDYAHTHHALHNLLLSVKNLKPRKIIVIFGCGGDRDKSKRPLMGKIATKMADFVIITSDNPRTEDPMKIIKDIENGIPFYLRKKYKIIPDRKKAIFEGISMAKTNDCVVIAGKGHEAFQILKDVTIPFDDREEARKAIKEIINKKIIEEKLF
ncbi:MAG: UDP-N-acetylmuramoyl-L-alanyl-D-glutamate--2,6-diaminopimelate ligase [bacterium]|nr:UDP-N-acetylmuramoyl-L-alanyl-D-glutamate--2,6-diaminopimelate ligase [bacterium]MDW8163914.1 UDP-N-acetylmuramoyl-L-alanyl-D-glutamate--2,6-diaminopimelate ligase [Candidatus Omnitrophota bacterium]